MNSKYHHYITIAALGVSPLIFAACSDKQESTVAESARNAYEKTSRSVEHAADTVAGFSAEKWDQLKDATYDERVAFRDGVSKMADSVDNKLEQWSDHAGEMSGDAKQSWDNGVAKLRDAREDLKDELNKLGDATAETWDDVRAKVAKAWDRVEDAYQDLEQKVQS